MFVADDLGAWLVERLADAGRGRLSAWIFGTEQERALRSAATEAVHLTVGELWPGDNERAEYAALVISQVFGELVPSVPTAGPTTVLEALGAGIASQVAVLEDPGLTGTGQSSADLLGVSAGTLAPVLTGHVCGRSSYALRRADRCNPWQPS